MSHYAKILNGKVIQVIVAEEEFFKTFVDSSPGTWLQTSYNTRGGIHYGSDGQLDGGIALRGNYAGVGDTYNYQHDVFYGPQPYLSWTLDETTWTWIPPTPYPTDDKQYRWDETNVSWVERT
ncbi:hypothetical protein UFOVP94_7 [uncultured Caudovirales phage]|uniref:Uncharacterized protein n=1 Tax=uncultured Caudovirales phage TaxID=2100421 RepID=A0A6J5L2Q0_9CAUD|nr:hypothetical protein UFOVP94_7 [uncultured Caudovirales phage]CAB5212619.1 hypothetical protein UFOVP186_36 [uncultured Caudovirales phage]